MNKILEKEIARKGFLNVNLPVMLLIFGSWFALLYTESLSFQRCAIISGAIGWVYWAFAVDNWIRWSLLRGIEKDKLYRISNRNLLLWSEFKINKIAEKLKEK